MNMLRRLLASLLSRLPRNFYKHPETFEAFQSRGIHVLPVHFYQPSPNTDELGEEVFDRTSELIGIRTNAAYQESLIAEFAESYIKEFRELPDTPRPTHAYSRDAGFPGFDGAFIYSFVRKFRPRRIIEIGSGASTLLMSDALARNAAEDGTSPGKIFAVEPYPRQFLIDRIPKGHELIEKKVQSIPLEFFEKLEENDILFIDSSHVSKIDSDVNYEILEVLPRLQRGVIIHVHDIYMPGEYPREWVKDRRIFWNEQYMLQSFLTFNDHFEMMWSAGYMKKHGMAQLQQHIPDYLEGWSKGGSIWLRKRA